MGRKPTVKKPGLKAQPETVNILGKTYNIIYVDNPAEVDMYKRESLWGQIDFWTRTIRIYKNTRTTEDLWQSIIHECLHAITEELKLRLRLKENHEELDLLALALTDTFFRNGWLDPKG